MKFDDELVENSLLSKLMKARFKDAKRLYEEDSERRYSNFEVAQMLQTWAKELSELAEGKQLDPTRFY